jgi:periplasmic divalent cation tolerance protein
MDQEIIILSTVPSAIEGEKIAEFLVTNKIAACVNIIPNIKSIYEWQGKMQRDNELLLIIKTTTQNESQVYDKISVMHSFDIPEIISLKVENIDKKYSEWLNSVVKFENNGKDKN